jgi:DHA1 family bicyclomycin/chloramphenicol resistance-like MFS transporter
VTRLPATRLADRIRLVVILGGLSAFGPLSIDLYLPGLPALSEDLGARAWEGQLTLTSCLTGLALGQLLAGPLSDRLGRRRPLVVGLAGYCVASIACAASPSVYVLVALRLLQGLAGAAGIVIARAVVRDLRSGAAAARLFSLLILVTGLAPTLAPIMGGQLLRVTSWRGLFVVLAAIVFVLLVGTAAGLPETLPHDRRDSRGWLQTTRTFHDLVRARLFIGYAVVLSLSFGEMFAYISGSSFVLEHVYGVSPQLFGGIFALNALGLVGCAQLNGALVGRVSARRLLAVGLGVGACAGVSLLVVVLVGGLGLAGVLPCLFAVVSSIGFVLPNATALALTDYPHVAGTASALLGVLQFAVGATIAPLVGITGTHSAVPMATAVAALGIASAGAMIATHRNVVTSHERPGVPAHMSD